MTVINRLLISVLPLELAQDVYTYSGSDHERAKMAGALLTGYFLPLFSIDFLESWKCVQGRHKLSHTIFNLLSGILRKHYSNLVLSATPLFWFHTLEDFFELTHKRSSRALNLAFCVKFFLNYKGHCQVLPARCRSLRTPSKQKQLVQTLIACLYDTHFFTIYTDPW